jgi:hypothetical protein
MSKIRILFVTLSLFAAGLAANAALKVSSPIENYHSGNKYLYQYKDAEGRLGNVRDELYYLAVVDGKLVVIHNINDYMDFRQALWLVHFNEPNASNLIFPSRQKMKTRNCR